MILSLVLSFEKYLAINKVEFIKIILIKLNICHLIRLKYYHLRLSKNNCILV